MSISVEDDLDQLTRSIESRDTAALLTRYREDAEICVVDSDTSLPPRVVVGRDEIREWFEQLGWSAMKHQVVKVDSGSGQLSWTDHCRTASGLNFVYQSAAELSGGLIRRQRVTVVWEDRRY